MKIDEHVRTAPSAQNALDVFQDEWASSMPPESGLRAGDTTANFYNDIRIHWGGGVLGGFEGKSVLEIGPLEAGQTYTICRLGARSVTAVESSPRAYLKCLIIKEVFGLGNAHFHLGDGVEYLRQCTESFDVCVASGVLYHMTNPIEFLDLIAPRSDRLLIWTHYYDFEILDAMGLEAKHFRRREITMTARGEAFVGYKNTYADTRNPLFLGGTHEYSCWLPRPTIERALRLFGFTDIQYNLEDTAHPHGPCVTICASR